MNLEIFRYLTLASVGLYFAFDFWDSRRIKDEREELIQLKTFELVHKLMMFSLTAIAFVLVYDPFLPSIYTIMVIVLAAMYGEVFAKVYYRTKY